MSRENGIDRNIRSYYQEVKRPKAEKQETEATIDELQLSIGNSFLRRKIARVFSFVRIDYGGIGNLRKTLNRQSKELGSARRHLDQMIGNRFGQYKVETVDLFDISDQSYTKLPSIVSAPSSFVSVHFQHNIDGEPYIAEYHSSFIRVRGRRETKNSFDSQGALFSIRPNDHPLLILPKGYLIRFFKNVGSEQWLEREVTQFRIERQLDISCLAVSHLLDD